MSLHPPAIPARNRSWLVAAVVVAAMAAVLVARARWSEDEPPEAPVPSPRPARAAAAEAPLPAPPAMPTALRWLAIGGGAEPASNQVSIEQDLALARTVLGDGGVLLFAGGVGRSPVQVLADAPADPLRRRLGDLFHPRDGRAARYRPTTLEPHGDATLATVRRVLSEAFATPGDPLLVFVVAHGDPGQTARDNTVALWGAQPITVADVGALADRAARPLRFVVTTCFSGGFGELAFRDSDAGKGHSLEDRCGLFAATWDTQASGCDPNPDRRAQESYGLHFLRAIERRDRDDKKLALSEIDYDGDGKVSLFEAHTRVRIASRSFSIPTTTSERWLREVAPEVGASAALALPEEAAVIAALSERLRLPDAASAAQRLRALRERADRADAELAALERQLDARWAQLRIALLERWPVLDDPYHPAYADMLAGERERIVAFLDGADEAKSHHRAGVAVDKARVTLDEFELEGSLAERLVRAHENVELGARLNARPGRERDHYLRLLACERSTLER